MPTPDDPDHLRTVPQRDLPDRRRDGADGLSSPCIVEECDATCVIPPGVRAELDDLGDILIQL